eukprot:GHRR01013561.1.p1 GENE.GHRR01013561.1~~GHRR01013561.1.p1  ORF type:complete len:310 (+),score=84.43 GHRR01013561.1:4033-4962(+)
MKQQQPFKQTGCSATALVLGSLVVGIKVTQLGSQEPDAVSVIWYCILAGDRVPASNAVFDESGNFILVPTLLGIKVINLTTNAVSRMIGKPENTERFLRIALWQGLPKKHKIRAGMQELKLPARDPTLVACAYKKQRLYLFTRREPADAEDAAAGRDVFNEKPSTEELLAADGAGAGASALPRGACMHTTKGDITLRLFPDECPRTVENFTTHARNGYYDHVIFHRVIKGFMLQTGDPLGDGTGGESIWGGEFEDEFRSTLHAGSKHTACYGGFRAGCNPAWNVTGMKQLHSCVLLVACNSYWRPCSAL